MLSRLNIVPDFTIRKMKKKPLYITVGAMLNFMVTLKILTPDEGRTARKTGRLPDSIMTRLENLNRASKN